MINMASDLVWIHAHVEEMRETDDYVSYTRAEWDAMSERQREEAISDAAIAAMNDAGGCGASVVDESDVPAEYLAD